MRILEVVLLSAAGHTKFLGDACPKMPAQNPAHEWSAQKLKATFFLTSVAHLHTSHETEEV